MNKATTTAKIANKPASTPKLRFPKFRSAQQWEYTLLAPYLVDCSGRVPSDTKLPIYSSTREGLKRQDAYFDGRVLQNNNEYGVVPPGCFVYRHMSDDGLFKFNINETGGEIAVSKEYPVFKTKGLNSRFLLEKLNEGPDFRQFALSQKAGGTRTRLYFNRLCEWQTLLPLLPEQQRIADCLTSVDDLIDAQARKVDALKTHKKGLMQQLFPRPEQIENGVQIPAETQPRLRFPEFHNAGEWEPKRLEEITDSVFDGTHQTPTYTSDGVPFYSVENLISGNANKFISHSDYLLATKKNKPEKGDVLLTRIGKIGYSQVVNWDHDFSVYVTLAVIKQAKEFNSHYLHYLIQSDFYQSELRAKSLPNAVPPKINLDSLRATAVLLTNEAEQQRIADCFISLDDIIAAQTQKLDAFKTHKKGLMQQLFPSTGKDEA